MKKDLEFSKRIKQAWESYERGEFNVVDYDNFIKKL